MKRAFKWLKRGSPLLFLFALFTPVSANAQIGSDRYASITIDARTGDVLSAANPDEPRYPASLTKMMTIYMLFEALRDRRVSLNQLVPVSAHAAAMMPSKLGLVPGTVITVEQALLGLVTKSANDAAAALGELLGGDEDRFAQMMTMRARALGMSRTTFRNASGWPDPNQLTTARDLSILARHLVQDYPIEYRYFSTPSFVFHGRVIPNHDRMLQSYPGADGMKTGYTEASGCNLVTSAVRGDVRLIGVVMGASNGSERDIHMASLLDAGFDRLGVPVAPYEGPRVRYPAMVAAASAATLSASGFQQSRGSLSHWQPRHKLRGHGRIELRHAQAPGRPMRQDINSRQVVAPAKASASRSSPRAIHAPAHSTPSKRNQWSRSHG